MASRASGCQVSGLWPVRGWRCSCAGCLCAWSVCSHVKCRGRGLRSAAVTTAVQLGCAAHGPPLAADTPLPQDSDGSHKRVLRLTLALPPSGDMAGALGPLLGLMTSMVDLVGVYK